MAPPPCTALPAHMQRQLEDLARRKGFRKPRYAVARGGKTGDNYIGIIYRVEVTEEGDVEPALRLIFKGMPTSPKRREQMRVVNFFDNEFHAYCTVLPGLARFLADKGLEELKQPGVFPHTARCHDAASGGEEGQDTLVLEDMRPLGFVMQDRRVGLDEHHIRAVFKSLSFLHAASMAMEAQRPKEFATLRGLVSEVLFDQSNPMVTSLDQVVQRTYGFVAERFPEGSAGHKKLQGLIEKYAAKAGALVAPSASTPGASTPNAISHGDSWTNNFLFKHSKTGGKPEEVCLVDFQLSRYAPPVLDLMYAVYCCTTREWRDAHLDEMLREYHAMLSATLRRLGSDPEELYPWATMQAQLKERGRFGLVMAVLTVPLFVADSEELPDLDAQFESGKDVGALFTVESKSAPERNKRLSDTLEEMIQRGWM